MTERDKHNELPIPRAMVNLAAENRRLKEENDRLKDEIAEAARILDKVKDQLRVMQADDERRRIPD
jgi:cell division septum initiation protein DivIVA